RVGVRGTPSAPSLLLPRGGLGLVLRLLALARLAARLLAGRLLLLGRLGAAGAAEDKAADEVADVDRVLGRLDLAAGRDEVVLAPRLERDIVAAQQAVGGDLGDGIFRQLDRAVDGQRQDGQETRGVEPGAHHPADLDAAELDVAARGDSVDP